MPAVSVIIPCYNQGHFLEEAVDSVLRQDFEDYEILVVNDGSTHPETRRILSQLEHPRLRMIHTTNQGLPEARNTGIREAAGEFILPLDADDRIGPRYMGKAVSLLRERPEVGLVYCEAEFFGEMRGKWELPPYRFPDILVSPRIFPSGFYRRSDWEKTGGYAREMRYGWEDFEFWISLIELGVGVHQIPEVHFYYRRTAGVSVRNLSQISLAAL